MGKQGFGVTGTSIRWRILKVNHHDGLYDTLNSYRDFDPMEDTERLNFLPISLEDLAVTGTSIRWRILKVRRGDARPGRFVSYRDFDPMEDTERAHGHSLQATHWQLQGLRSDGGY